MDPLVPCQQLPFGDTGFLLQPRVLIDKLDEGTVVAGLVRTIINTPAPPLPVYEKTTDLFLDKCQLFKVPLQERHFLLLGFTVAISNHIVVLFTDFVQLNLQLNHLKKPGQRLS